MSKLDNSSYRNDVSPLENSEGQRGLLSNNIASFRCPSLDLSEDTLSTLEALGSVLRRVRVRMKSEGLEIIDGKIIDINTYEKSKTKD